MEPEAELVRDVLPVVVVQGMVGRGTCDHGTCSAGAGDGGSWYL